LEEFQVNIENVVAFASLGSDIPLTSVSGMLENAEYAPESFPGLVYRINEPKVATLIFSSGKLVCTGAKNIDMAKEGIHTVVGHIRDLGISLPTEFDIRIENIVASTKIEAKVKLNLEEIAFSLDNTEYEPESFPGLVFRIKDPRVAFLLFGSGKIICTGARTIEDIHTALGKLKGMLEGIGVEANPVGPEDEAKPEDSGEGEEPSEPADSGEEGGGPVPPEDEEVKPELDEVDKTNQGLN
jgi:transcription initiation factor TFIID TATA-box-binding protein